MVRIQWKKDHIGEVIFHCHNLFHEDGGMMAFINVFPIDTQVAVAPVAPGPTARSFELDATGSPSGRVVASVAPFGPRYRGGMNAALGDVNGDTFADLIVASPGGSRPFVLAYSGRTGELLTDSPRLKARFEAG